jgi:hypothetical protein
MPTELSRPYDDGDDDDIIIIIIIIIRGIYQRVGLTQGPSIKPAQRYKAQNSLNTQRQNTEQTKQMLYRNKSSVKSTGAKAIIIIIIIIITKTKSSYC